MKTQPLLATPVVVESLRGIVDRVTYHNPDNGWSVLRVSPFDNPHRHETVTVHQTKVFAGATMAFFGAWTFHPKFGRQFKATRSIEEKPATAAALEKYIGSGLIRGVGPKIARKIVRHFGDQTLAVFEDQIARLTEVNGIASKKLETITAAWVEHRAIRDVMMFLQSHGISTLFAVRIYRQYGDNAIAIVSDDPYRLAQDIYGIGFFSADKVALSIGLDRTSPQRIRAAINHVLAASRELGHCFLTQSQISAQVNELLDLSLDGQMPAFLAEMQREGLIMARRVVTAAGQTESGYYSKALYFDELYVARRLGAATAQPAVDGQRVADWIQRYCQQRDLALSPEQAAAVQGIVAQKVAVLTGGPGCGKTTTTMVIVGLLRAMGRKILLAAPTGRAAQRMMDVIGCEAKTIHRLLEWHNGQFKKNAQSPLDVDFIVIDEASMLDIGLTASLLKAVPGHSQILLIGDADQLPSVGAGNVLRDIIASGRVPCFCLQKVFRQARQSLIIRHAHQINQGQMPHVDSPFKKPDLWRRKVDCLFVDADEATQAQLAFIAKVKRFYETTGAAPAATEPNPYEFRVNEPIVPYATELTIPPQFQHVDIEALSRTDTRVAELLAVLKTVHPWSALRYGLTATAIVQKLYLGWIPKYFGAGTEIQILCPMTRGSLGTTSLNHLIQQTANPAENGKGQVRVGERIFRVGDRVIHRRNNYTLGVFNGDIGTIAAIDAVDIRVQVRFFPDHRLITYGADAVAELELAYAITIHKSQGSEFEAVILPVLTQHFKMLYRNLIYTGLTRAKKLAVLVGTRQALAMAVANQDTSQRQTWLKELLQDNRFFYP